MEERSGAGQKPRPGGTQKKHPQRTEAQQKAQKSQQKEQKTEAKLIKEEIARHTVGAGADTWQRDQKGGKEILG